MGMISNPLGTQGYITGKAKILVQIFTHSGSVVDISFVTAQVQIYEELFKSTSSMNVFIVDGVDIQNEHGIVGGEKIRYTLYSEDDGIEFITGEYVIFKIGERIRQKQDVEVYVINCVSQEYLANFSKTIESTFEGDTVSNYVKNIFDEHFAPVADKKMYFLEQSDGICKFYPTRKDPMSYIKFLAEEAKGVDNQSSSFIFYESKEGYNFCTLEYLMRQNPAQIFIYDVHKTLHSDQGAEGNLRNSRNIIYLNQNATFDMMNSQRNGQLAIRTLVLNPMRKSFGKNEFNYGSDFGMTGHIGPGSVLNPKAREVFAPEPTLEKFIVSDHELFNSSYVKAKDSPTANLIRKRQDFSNVERSLTSQLHNVRTNISVPGNPYIKVGDTISIILPALGLKPEDDDKYISGKYLITALSHKINAATNDYISNIELMRDAYEVAA